MKYKTIEIETDSTKITNAGFVWVRPSVKFGSGMNLAGGFNYSVMGRIDGASFHLYQFASSRDEDTSNVEGSELSGKGSQNFTYMSNVNLSFFKTNPLQFDKALMELMGLNVVYLRKYSKEQAVWAKKLCNKFFKGQKVVIGEFYPHKEQEGVIHIYLSDTYCFFKYGGEEVEFTPLEKIATKKKTKMSSKKERLKALDSLSGRISDRDIIDMEFKHRLARARCIEGKGQIKEVAAGYKKYRTREVVFAKAEQAAKAVLTADELKLIEEIHAQASRDTRGLKVDLDKRLFEYKRQVKMSKSPIPKKEDYEIDSKQMNKEFLKIKRFIADGTIEKFEYEPKVGVVITFPPMVYKSFRGGGYLRIFLGRPRVVIHDPAVCERGSAACGIIRFTLPSYERAYGSTDHFDNTNGPNMTSCSGHGSREGQCLGSSSNESFLQLFVPLISSRRFGELIPHLKSYILESNKLSPLLTPPENMMFSSDLTARVPSMLKDDSWTEYCKSQIKKDQKELSPV